jgi:peptide/nickel transport system substrate-binding protein
MNRTWHTWKTFCRLLVLVGMLLVWMDSAGLARWAAAQTPAASGAGSSLIGTLEGPQVITDAAQFPRQFSEAPQLAESVKAGKLPPVAERIGQDPLVIKPVHEIGKYGGTWRRGFTGPADFWNGLHSVSGPDHILFWDYTGYKVGPNIARGWELSDDGRTTTLLLRRGMKWSDGHPFTADDFVFWYEDIYKNKELVPTPTIFLSINGKPGEVEKVDTYTVRFKFADPYPIFPEMLAGATPIGGGHSLRGREGMGGYAPAHYLKQFHPKYTSKEELDKKLKEQKFDKWWLLFLHKNSWHLNPDLPVVTPWKTVTPANTPVWTLERNPYSIWVDTAGNQLPYIDRAVFTLAESEEILNLRAIAGEYDNQLFHLSILKVPVFLDNEKRGGYKVSLHPGDYGGDLIIKFNMTYDKDPEIAKWFHNRDFRRALAIAINREQINEIFWLGTSAPRSVVPVDSNPYFPGPEYRTMWATYEPQQARAMLDAIGLDKKDAEGYRLRSDGKGRLRLVMTVAGAAHAPFEQFVEPVKQHWKDVGISLDIEIVERSLAMTRGAANETQLSAWNNDGTEHPWSFPFHLVWLSISTNAPGGPEYARWFHSGGKEGKEPTGRIREMMDLWVKGMGVSEEERLEIGKQLWKIAAEDVYIIGIVGPGAASGVRAAKTTMGNLPARMYISPDGKAESISRPVTYFYKN